MPDDEDGASTARFAPAWWPLRLSADCELVRLNCLLLVPAVLVLVLDSVLQLIQGKWYGRIVERAGWI